MAVGAAAGVARGAARVWVMDSTRMQRVSGHVSAVSHSSGMLADTATMHQVLTLGTRSPWL